MEECDECFNSSVCLHCVRVVGGQRLCDLCVDPIHLPPLKKWLRDSLFVVHRALDRKDLAGDFSLKREDLLPRRVFRAWKERTTRAKEGNEEEEWNFHAAALFSWFSIRSQTMS